MLPILTGLVAAAVGAMHEKAHLEILAPVAAGASVRGGNLGGYWALGKGLIVWVTGAILLLARAVLGLAAPDDRIVLALGLVMLGGGIGLVYRATRLTAHDHPHIHPHTSHEHIHLHRLDSQLHDHDRSPAGLLALAWTPQNLAMALPVLGLGPTSAVVYLGVVLPSSMLATSVLGYWLGNSRKHENDPRWVVTMLKLTGAGCSALGLVWILEVWPG
ncbi:MAG: hypothetical protein L0Z47_07895 [Actinobacteria bacterium]|nr:hypothetical protein [Actinomycetota bacterium]